MLIKTDFQKLIEKVKKDQPKLHERSLQSLDWYSKKIQTEFGSKQDNPLKVYETKSKKQPPFIGQLLTFEYSPKNKKTLNYYDRYPLILTLGMSTTHILGLNFHYLKPLHRIIFMDQLYKYLGTKMNEPVIKIDYTKLIENRNLIYYKPCIKQYLFKNISQQVSTIKQEEWELALFLPTEKFFAGIGGTVNKQKVWNESATTVKKG